MVSLVNRWAISLRVRGICLAGWGWRVCSVAAALVRVTHRCQEVQVRTWCSSRPVRPLLAWKFSSMV
jgi:hypothetical protein